MSLSVTIAPRKKLQSETPTNQCENVHKWTKEKIKKKKLNCTTNLKPIKKEMGNVCKKDKRKKKKS